MLRKQKYYRIPDPVHGWVKVSDVEYDLLKTSSYQRLKRVKQLGPANLYFPSANHSRFEHSLGVAYVTKRMIDRLFEIGEIDKDDLVTYLPIVRYAALLHDVAHTPYSHTVEEILATKDLASHFKTPLNHEEIGYRLIMGTVDEVYPLEDLDTQIIHSCLEGQGFSTTDIQLIASVATERYEFVKKTSRLFLTDLITGDFGSDRIDYLVRDSFHSGLSYGNIEVNHLLDSLRLVETDDGMKRLGVSSDELRKGLYSASFLLLGRGYHFANIAHNILLRSATGMIRSALDDLVDKMLKEDPSEVLKLFLVHDDSTLLRLFEQYNATEGKRWMQEVLDGRIIGFGHDLDLRPGSHVVQMDEVHPFLCFYLNIIAVRKKSDFLTKIQKMFKEKYSDPSLIFDLDANGVRGIPTRLFLNTPQGIGPYSSILMTDKSLVLNSQAQQLAVMGSIGLYSNSDRDQRLDIGLLANEAKNLVEQVRRQEVVRQEWLLMVTRLIIPRFQNLYIQKKGRGYFRGTIHGMSRFMRIIKELDEETKLYNDFESFRTNFVFSGKVYRDLMFLAGVGLLDVSYTLIGSDTEGRKTQVFGEVYSTTRRYDIRVTNYGEMYYTELDGQQDKAQGYLVDEKKLEDAIERSIN